MLIGFNIVNNLLIDMKRGKVIIIMIRREVKRMDRISESLLFYVALLILMILILTLW